MSPDLRLTLLWLMTVWADILAVLYSASSQPFAAKATIAASTSALNASSSPGRNTLDHTSSLATRHTSSRPSGWLRSMRRALRAAFTNVTTLRSAGAGSGAAGRPGVHATRRSYRGGRP